MLEIICIEASFDNAGVRCNRIFDLNDLECDAFLLKDGLCLLQDLGVRCDAGTYLKNCCLCLILLTCCDLRSLYICRASCEGSYYCKCKCSCYNSLDNICLHDLFSFSFFFLFMIFG